MALYVFFSTHYLQIYTFYSKIFFHLWGGAGSLFLFSKLYMSCVPFLLFNILELGMVELDMPVYFLCPLILIFSSSQGQTLSDLNIVKN